MAVKPTKRCEVMSCNNLAQFGFTDPKWCEMHAHQNAANMVEQPCALCQLPNVLHSNGMCYLCNEWTYNPRARLAKQHEVEQCLRQSGFSWTSTDRKIPNACGAAERPDFLFDHGWWALVLEVDEHQHQERDCACEQTRMVNIAETLGCPTLFVRYNPDAYTPASGKQLGKRKRIDTLQRVIANPPSFVSDAAAGALYLFFDGHTPDDCSTVHTIR